VTFNLIQQEDLDIQDDEPVISLISNLSQKQWKLILEKIDARIILSNQDDEIIAQVGANSIFALPIEELKTYLLDQLNHLLV